MAALIVPQRTLTWARTIVANRVATDGASWVRRPPAPARTRTRIRIQQMRVRHSVPVLRLFRIPCVSSRGRPLIVLNVRW